VRQVRQVGCCIKHLFALVDSAFMNLPRAPECCTRGVVGPTRNVPFLLMVAPISSDPGSLCVTFTVAVLSALYLLNRSALIAPVAFVTTLSGLLGGFAFSERAHPALEVAPDGQTMFERIVRFVSAAAIPLILGVLAKLIYP
jgi:hypothetical protein